MLPWILIFYLIFLLGTEYESICNEFFDAAFWIHLTLDDAVVAAVLVPLVQVLQCTQQTIERVRFRRSPQRFL